RFKENLFLGLQHLAKHLPEFSPPHHATEKMGEYVLGGLSENEEKLVYKLMNDDAGVSRIALLWEAQFTHLLSQLPPQVASRRVSEIIKNPAFARVQLNPVQNPDADQDDGTDHAYTTGLKITLRKLWFMLPLWRAAALLLAIAAF